MGNINSDFSQKGVIHLIPLVVGVIVVGILVVVVISLINRDGQQPQAPQKVATGAGSVKTNPFDTYRNPFGKYTNPFSQFVK